MYETLKIFLSGYLPGADQDHVAGISVRAIHALRAVAATLVFWSLTELLSFHGAFWLLTIFPAMYCLTCGFLFLFGLVPCPPASRRTAAHSVLIAALLGVRIHLVQSGVLSTFVDENFGLLPSLTLISATLLHAALCFRPRNFRSVTA